MNILCILIFMNFLKLLNSLHLNNYQITLINNLIQNPLLQNKQRETINLVLYNAYEKWAIKKALDFKKLHKYKCNNIKTEELVFSSKIGLFKAIKKYNGQNNLINYSSIYVNWELLKVLTDKYSLSILPKNYRRKNKTKFSKEELYKYKLLLNTKFGCYYEFWQLDSIFVNNNEDVSDRIIKKYDDINKLNLLVSNLSPFSKRILFLKYNNDNNTNFSNKKISELMCCSEETIRKELIKIKQKVNI